MKKIQNKVLLVVVGVHYYAIREKKNRQGPSRGARVLKVLGKYKSSVVDAIVLLCAAPKLRIHHGTGQKMVVQMPKGQKDLLGGSPFGCTQVLQYENRQCQKPNLPILLCKAKTDVRFHSL